MAARDTPGSVRGDDAERDSSGRRQSGFWRRNGGRIRCREKDGARPLKADAETLCSECVRSGWTCRTGSSSWCYEPHMTTVDLFMEGGKAKVRLFSGMLPGMGSEPLKLVALLSLRAAQAECPTIIGWGDHERDEADDEDGVIERRAEVSPEWGVWSGIVRREEE
jgi:hypothetical protein